MDDASRANRLEVVKYLYSRSKTVFSSNIGMSKYNSEVHIFLKKKSNFLQYRDI